MELTHRLLNNTLGCTFIGILFEVMFWGFSCAQTLFYYYEYPKDTLALKSFVAFLWALDTARTGLDVAYLWYYVITQHANLDVMEIFPNSFLAEFFLSSVTVLLVQLYLTHTIWRFLLRKVYRYVVTASVVLLAFLSFAGGVASVAEFTRDPDVIDSLENATVTASIQTVTALLADIYIAVALSFILYRQRTGYARTDGLITQLITYSIHRGIFTALMQLLHFATFIGTLQYGANELIWSLFHFPGSKVYVNSLLALLNLRHHIWSTAEIVDMDGIIQLQEITPTVLERDREGGIDLPYRIVVTTEVTKDRQLT